MKSQLFNVQRTLCIISGMGWKMMKVAGCYPSLILCALRILPNGHNEHGEE